MGMALDEPDKHDRTYSVDGLDFLIGPEEEHILQMFGPLVIDYSNNFFGKGFSIYLAGGGGC